MIGNTELPLQYSFKEAIRVYIKRLAFLLAIAFSNYLLIGYVMPVRDFPVFSLVVCISFNLVCLTLVLLHNSTHSAQEWYILELRRVIRSTSDPIKMVKKV